MQTRTTYKCVDCNNVEPDFPEGGGTSNYLIWGNDKVCKTCSTKRTQKEMDTGKPIILYFINKKAGDGRGVPNRATVSDVGGGLKFPALYSIGNHNWRGVKRYDVWFRDHNRRPWYGVCISGGVNEAFKARPVKDSPRFPVAK